MYEVEAKYRLSDADALRAALADAGFTLDSTVSERDTYLRHPARDFAATDEALRLRQTTGDRLANSLTYKGAREPGVAKSREELIAAADDADKLRTIFARLGFEPVADVVKRRQTWTGSGGVVVTIDAVDRVGTYAEIELVADDSADRRTIESRLLAIGDSVGLLREAIEPRSYLELLLEGDAA